jgi:hypothetical protein
MKFCSGAYADWRHGLLRTQTISLSKIGIRYVMGCFIMFISPCRECFILYPKYVF